MYTMIIRTVTLIIALTLWSVPAASAGVTLDRIVAVINNEPITWSELYRAMEFEMKDTVEAMTREQKQTFLKDKEAAFLEQMIDKRLQLQTAKKKRMIPSPAEIDAAIKSIRDKYSFDEDEFRKLIKDEGMSMLQYRDVLSDQMALGRVLEREVKSRIDVTVKDLKAYLDERGLKGAKQYRISQIFLKAAPEGESDDNMDRAATIMKDLRGGGESFAEIAAKYSEGPAAQRGGDLGYIQQDELASEFVDAIRDLSPGEVSEPFTTSRGTHIIKLEEIRDPRDAVREALLQERFRQWLKALRAEALIDIRL